MTNDITEDTFDPEVEDSAEHHFVGPSAFYTLLGPDNTVRCLGSVRAQYGKPDPDSEAAIDGTRSHMLLEDTLNTILQELADGEELDATTCAHDFIGQVYLDVPVDEDRADRVQETVDYVKAQALEKDGTVVWVEQRVELDDVLPGMFGKVDVAWADYETRELVVLDKKDGRINVEVIQNPQNKGYALGLLPLAEALGDIDTVRCVISQPLSGGIKEWWISVEDLRAWRDTVLKPTIQAALRPDAPRTPGYEQCRFCRAAGSCRELAESSLAVVFANLEPLKALSDPEGYPARRSIPDLTPDEQGVLFSQIKMVEAFTEALRKEVAAAVEAGRSVPFVKQVAGRAGNRTWRDEATVIEMLRKRKVKRGLWMKEALRTPTQVMKHEKTLPKKVVADLSDQIYRSAAKPQIVSWTDPRPAFSNVASVDDFDAE